MKKFHSHTLAKKQEKRGKCLFAKRDFLTHRIKALSKRKDLGKGEVNMPLDFDEIYDELKSLTNNFTKDNIILHTDYEEEKNDSVIILKNYYDIVEVSDGRMHEDEEMCYVIAVSSPKNRNISLLERK